MSCFKCPKTLGLWPFIKFNFMIIMILFFYGTYNANSLVTILYVLLFVTQH